MYNVSYSWFRCVISCTKVSFSFVVCVNTSLFWSKVDSRIANLFLVFFIDCLLSCKINLWDYCYRMCIRILENIAKRFVNLTLLLYCKIKIRKGRSSPNPFSWIHQGRCGAFVMYFEDKIWSIPKFLFQFAAVKE